MLLRFSLESNPEPMYQIKSESSESEDLEVETYIELADLLELPCVQEESYVEGQNIKAEEELKKCFIMLRSSKFVTEKCGVVCRFNIYF